MAHDEAALIFVQPEDDIPSLREKLREARGQTVELLVPDTTRLLQKPANWTPLLRVAERENIHLLLISSDELTLAAARQHNIETFLVEDGQVVAPSMPANTRTRRRSYTDAQLSPLLIAATRDRPAHTGSTTVPPSAVPADTSDRDMDFMAELDSLSDEMPTQRNRAVPPPYPATSADDEMVAQFDELDAAFGDLDATPAPPRAAPRRIRPEDIELTDDEKARASSVKGRPSSSRPRSFEPVATPSTARTRTADLQTEPRNGSTNLLRGVLIALVVLVLVGLVLFWLFSGQLFGPGAVVTVVLPASPTESVPIEDEPIFIAVNSTANSEQAVVAQQVVVDTTFSATGQVTDQTLAPTTFASGIVTVYSQGGQPLFFPQGTEFVATNAQGQPVIFTADSDFSIPAAATRREGAQI
ncbi:MAG: hypothetical protein HC914_19480, partial [Chloroflexaceae bacterium]|nr:hypothetical protein [Chloroflexaceae bacterium]